MTKSVIAEKLIRRSRVDFSNFMGVGVWSEQQVRNYNSVVDSGMSSKSKLIFYAFQKKTAEGLFVKLCVLFVVFT